MAVYTHISSGELQLALDAFELKLEGAPEEVGEGIENTTYFFRAALPGGKTRYYVLTILENTPRPQVDFSTALTRHLARSGLPVPAPLDDIEGNSLLHIAGKSGLIFPRVQGHHPQAPGESSCTIIGDFLGRAHLLGQSLHSDLENHRGLPWLANASQSLEPFLDPEDRALLSEQVARYRSMSDANPDLPAGPIHGDLFTDNTLFLEGCLVGVIDYYNACRDWLLLDVAIALNDWCKCDKSGQVDSGRANALLDAYHRIRPFTGAEREYWQDILCIAATRFWASRLMGIHTPQLLGGDLKTKNPDEFRRQLLHHRTGYPPLPGGE